MLNASKLLLSQPVTTGFSKKLFKNNLFYALVVIFNRVSRERISEVGPDRACAEWLMRNGALIKWKNDNQFITNYNNLPLDKEQKGRFLLKEVDATNSGISYQGFPHFENCNHIDYMKIDNCVYINDKAIKMLSFLKNSLEHLEIGDCADVSDEGMKSLSLLVNLKKLKIGHMESVKNMKNVIEEIRKALPNVNITRPEITQNESVP